MAIIVRWQRLSLRVILSFLGFLLFVAGLTLLGLDVARLQGWALSADHWILLVGGRSAIEFWHYAKEFASLGGAALVAAGLVGVALGRSVGKGSAGDEEIDVKAVGDWIRAFEQVQVRQRHNHQRPS